MMPEILAQASGAGSFVESVSRRCSVERAARRAAGTVVCQLRRKPNYARPPM